MTLVMDDKTIGEFQSPHASFRGAPFWSWNDDLDEARLMRQIGWLEEMGFGGFHIHVRTGLRLEYLGPSFMDRVRACVEEAARRGLKTWLYDEDRWPSGYGGGLVTVEPRFRQRYLLFTPRPYGPTPPALPVVTEFPAERNERGRLLARYAVRLEDGALADYRRLAADEVASPGATVWYAYLETDWPCIGYNNQTLADIFNPDATRRFLASTHERYHAAVGAHFGTTVPAMFTDEPHPLHKRSLTAAAAREDIRLPFTDDFGETYRAAYGDDLLDRFPEVVWDLPGERASVTRWRYHDHAAERLVTGFLEPIHEWCVAHGILSTGHLVEESTLESQTSYDGEVMRGYRALELPGMDLLNDELQLNTAKQVQSAARQLGRPGVLSELYGLTGWDCSFAAFKGQGDWQAALGVTLRVPHLSWVSMAGEAKRDCPGPISYQQPWWREWRILEDHFARLNVVLTRGRPVVRLAVIHPIESYWLCFGPAAETAARRDLLEKRFAALTEWLLGDLLDFDFVAESLLPSQAGGPGFRVGEMNYDAVVVPPMRTIRRTTIERLEAFADAGGTVIFAGDIPKLVDVLPSERAMRLAERCRRVAFTHEAVLAALSPWRVVKAATPDGQPFRSLLHQLRREGEDRHLFLCNTGRPDSAGDAVVQVRGAWDLTRLDTMTGGTCRLASRVENGWTVFRCDIPAQGHLLATLTPCRADRPQAVAGARPRWESLGSVSEPLGIRLSEPNMLPLDRARWRWNDEPWQPSCELRGIEDTLRRRHGLQVRRSYCAQPWSETEPAPVLGNLTLEFDITAGIGIGDGELAMEQPQGWDIRLDDEPVGGTVGGWWVDEAIRRIPLPSLAPGLHRLRLTTRFSRKTELEWLHLLGDFGVELDGLSARLTAPVRTLRWGDWTTQGLPFYTGNVTYRCALSAEGGKMALRLPPAPAPLLSLALDGVMVGRIAFAPYRLELGELAPGSHTLEITAFGHRHNAFDRIHREDGMAYVLKPMGPAAAPVLECEK